MVDVCDRCVSVRRSPLSSVLFSLRQPTSISWAQTFPRHINTTVRKRLASFCLPIPILLLSFLRRFQPPPVTVGACCRQLAGLVESRQARPAPRPGVAWLGPAAGEVSVMQIIDGPAVGRVCFYNGLGSSEVARIKTDSPYVGLRRPCSSTMHVLSGRPIGSLQYRAAVSTVGLQCRSFANRLA